MKMKELKDSNDRNVLELEEVTRSEVVVGEVGTAAPEFLAAAPFVIHAAMQ
jgi:hypothetical protein